MMLEREVPGAVADLVDELADRLDPAALDRYEAVDPYLSSHMLSALLAGEKGLRAENQDDRRRRVRLALERVRQVLRDLIDDAPAAENTDVAQMLRFVADTLSVPQGEVAHLLGVHVRTLQRWLAGTGVPEGADEARVRMVARTLAHLRHVYTAPGVVRWFERPHPQLDGRRPAELLADPLRGPELVRVAASSRSTVGS